MKKYSTYSVMAGGFLVMGVLLVLMEIVSVREINDLAEQTENMYRHPLTVSNAALEAETLILRMHREMKDVALATSLSQMEEAVARADLYESEVFDQFEIIHDRFLGDYSKVDTLFKAFVDWRPIRQKAIESIRAGKISEASEITKGEGAAHVAFLNREMRSFVTFARGKAGEFLLRSRSAKETSILFLRILMGAFLVFGVGVSYFVITRVRNSETKFRDEISARTRVENTLRESEERFRQSDARMRLLLGGISVGIGVENLQGRTITANEGWARILGYTPEEFLAMRFEEYTHPNDAADDIGLFKELAAGKRDRYQLEKRYIARDGRDIWGRLTRALIRDEAGKPEYCLGMVEDITERKLAEAQISKLAQDLESILDNAGEGIFGIDGEGRVSFVNSAGSQMLGYRPDEMVGQIHHDLVHHTKLDGLPYPVEDCPIYAVIQNGDVYRNSSDLFWRKDGKCFDVKYVSTPIKRSGEITGAVVVFEDITEHKTMERQLVQAQKMEAIGQLAAGLAHDLNNALAIVSMNFGLMAKQVGNSDTSGTFVDAAMRGIKRASDLTRKLQDFARRDMAATTRVSANDFIAEGEGLIAKSLTPAITLELELSDDAWAVEIDPGDFEASLVNLALNARDSMPGAGMLIIETANKVIDQTYVDRNPESTRGEFVMISVSDNGTGMPPEIREKVFEPFFSTKEVGKGTGLGLSMVHGFVRRSGGHVKIYSEPGTGTTVRLYLPRAEGTTEHVESRWLAADELPVGNETVLIVDDEEELVEAAVTILKSLGYRTKSAASGREALEIIEQDTSIDLLFSDIVMPHGMDGYQLAVEALKRRPNLKVLLTSGFTRKREKFLNGEGKLVSDLANAMLSKPYNDVELAVAVRNAIDRRN
ncbi:MAG: PAS domain S-box protein [Rhodospirillales bacterium]|nr:PAS domain S-box protein [Rhodospirillales bacterium]